MYGLRNLVYQGLGHFNINTTSILEKYLLDLIIVLSSIHEEDDTVQAKINRPALCRRPFESDQPFPEGACQVRASFQDR